MLRAGLLFRATTEGRSLSDMIGSEERSRNPASGTTNYLYDGMNDVEEVDNSGNVLARYTQDQAIDQPMSELRSGTASNYESDGIGSVTSLTNSTGTLANSYTYDSFGKLTASTGTLTNPFQYTGRDFDAETGLFFFRARYYYPGTGRLISEDPNGISAGINYYDYVKSDPTTLVDPFGLDSGPWHPPAGVHTKCLPTDSCKRSRERFTSWRG